jgi:hypothetical protein
VEGSNKFLNIIKFFLLFPKFDSLCFFLADPFGRAVEGVGLQPLACWDCGFESRQGA